MKHCQCCLKLLEEMQAILTDMIQDSWEKRVIAKKEAVIEGSFYKLQMSEYWRGQAEVLEKVLKEYIQESLASAVQEMGLLK